VKSEFLRFLEKNNFNVPNFTEFKYKKIVKSQSKDLNQLIKTSKDYSSIEQEKIFSEYFQDQTLSIRKNIDAEIKKIKKTSNANFAIRSSANVEDGNVYSFAGIFTSLLDVPFLKMNDSIFQVVKSLFSSQSIEYHNQTGINLENTEMNVIIQEMIYPKFSGVAFSFDPTNPNFIGISSVTGLGDKLLSGKVDGDYHKVSRDQLFKIESTPDENDNINLSSDQLIDICQVIKKLESLLKIPIDIEFGITNEEEFIIFQVRPQTIIPSTGIIRNIFDNSNIIESYNGVTTPLTFTFARKAYSRVYKTFLMEMGVSKKILEANSQIFDNMIAFIHNNIYYNLNGWYGGLKLLPGYKYNKTFMETMMGVSESFEEYHVKSKDKLLINSKHQYFDGLKQKFVNLKLITKLYIKHRQLNKIVKVFDQHFQTIMKNVEPENIETLSIDDLNRLDHFLTNQLLEEWKAPILNDFFLSIYFGIFKKINEKWLDKPVHNELLSGDLDVISIKPLELSMKITEAILSEGQEKLLNDNSNDTLLSYLKNNNQTSGKLFSFLIENFGDRTLDELKLEIMNLKDNPDFILNQIKLNFINQNFDFEAKGKQILENQQKTMLDTLSQLSGGIKGYFKKKYYLKFLKLTQVAIKNRETMRFYRTIIFGYTRKLYNRAGNIFVNLNLIDNPRDIYFLTNQEISDINLGKAVNTNLRSLVEIRKLEYEQNSKLELPERMITYGSVLSSLTHNIDNNVNINTDKLSGIACFGGIVTGKVTIINDPGLFVNEPLEIVVTKRTDPGWTPIFANIKGLIVERGSPLSHSAIVAREFGIPTIVKVKNVTKALKTGNIVTLNANEGKIIQVDDK
jgi:rifampicin phosphotransferase